MMFIYLCTNTYTIFLFFFLFFFLLFSFFVFFCCLLTAEIDLTHHKVAAFVMLVHVILLRLRPLSPLSLSLFVINGALLLSA